MQGTCNANCSYSFMTTKSQHSSKQSNPSKVTQILVSANQAQDHAGTMQSAPSRAGPVLMQNEKKKGKTRGKEHRLPRVLAEWPKVDGGEEMLLRPPSGCELLPWPCRNVYPL
jgi:hypothetical protein